MCGCSGPVTCYRTPKLTVSKYSIKQDSITVPYFFREFKKRYNCSPKEYREQYHIKIYISSAQIALKVYYSALSVHQTPKRKTYFALIANQCYAIMKVLHCFVLLFITGLYVPVAKSQSPPNQVIKGTVTDDTGLPLSGVSVSLKGSTTSVSTDDKGVYQIRVSGDKPVLVFTYVNYEKKEAAVNNRSLLNISMVKSNKSMDEVVIIGYGTQKKRDVTSSISGMKSSEIEKYNVNSFQSALQGQMPGVEMYESSGVPGAAVNVRIRGLNTVNGSAGPLLRGGWHSHPVWRWRRWRWAHLPMT